MAKKRIQGITVEIGGDTTDLAKSLKSVDDNIKNTQSQLKDVEKLLKLDPTNTELLSQKQRLLGEAVKDTKDRLDSLKTASEEAAKTKDNYDAWKAKITPIQTEIIKTTDELKKLKERSKEANEQLSKGEISQEQYDDLQREIKETGDKLKELKTNKEKVDEEFGKPVSPEQFDAIQREIIETEQDLQRLQNEADNSREALVKIGKAGESLQNVGGKISGVGQSLMPVTAGILGLGTAAVKTGADFDAEMSKVSAIAGTVKDEDLPAILETAEDMGLAFTEGADATETAMNILRAKAREMGSETKYSASEAGQALEYMAMAGWKTNDMLNGIEGIMNLAAASGEELGTTSDIVTDALTALGYTAADASHFANVLAAASSNANTNVSLMGESFQYCAPIAGSMKASAEDLAVALGLMANSGIKGSQAGNSLKNALVNLVKPTDTQAAAMENLGLIMTETQTVFDDDAIQKAQGEVEKKTLSLQKAQISYNAAVEKYGGDSANAQKALLNLEEAEKNLTDAQNALTTAQAGTVKEVRTGQNAFTDEYGNMKSLKEIMDVLRSSLSAVNVDLVDNDGNLREYDDIIAELSETEDGLTQAEQMKNAAILFGKQNLSGMLAIINASEDDYNDLTESIYNCDGTAQNMAETMQDNLSGQLTILMSQLQELAISFAEILMPAIRSIVTKIQGLMDKLNTLSPQTKETIVKIALIAASLGPLLIVVGKVISTVGTLMTVISKIPAIISKVKGGFTAVKVVLSSTTGTILGVVAIIGALVAAFVYFWNTNEDFRNFWIGLWEQIKITLYGFFDAFKTGWDSIISFFKNTWSNFQENFQIGMDAIKALWTNIWNAVSGFFTTIWTSIKNFLVGIWTAIYNDISTKIQFIRNIIVTVWNAIYTTIKPLLEAFKSLSE
ncbi:MAG: phage tail tape measure protein, partial [Ruminococcus sp.]|nr:phage tail tape measure protein [Ruminococcus sp.]